MVGSLIEAHLFGGMEENKECDYDGTLIDYSSAQGGDKSNICKDVIIETDCNPH
jgi:hypothetical protein